MTDMFRGGAFITTIVTASSVVTAGLAAADGPSGSCNGLLCSSTVVVTHGNGPRDPGTAPPPPSNPQPARPQTGSGSNARPATGGQPAEDPLWTALNTAVGSEATINGAQIGAGVTPSANGGIGPLGGAAAGVPTAPAATANPAPAAAQPAAPPVPSAAAWSEAVKTQMKLSSPKIGSAPCSDTGCMGAVGIPVWLWATDMPDKSTTITLGPYSVTAKATVSQLTWNLGDGRTLTCTDKGTPYDTSKGWAESPDCGTKYQKKGRYNVTGTATWHVTWTGVNTGDQNISASSNVTLPIGEYQALTR